MRYVLLLAIVATVGCSAFSIAPQRAGETQSAGELTQLSDAEIRATVEGHYIDIDHGAEGIAPNRIQRERFCGGVYTTRSDRVPVLQMAYSIGGGHLCVGAGASASCRTLHRDESGRLHMRFLRERGGDILKQVVVGPLSDCSN